MAQPRSDGRRLGVFWAASPRISAATSCWTAKGCRIRPAAGGVSDVSGSRPLGGRLAVEADEFDRSFLRLYPDVAVVTSADADHLDIYGTHEAVKEAFAQFVRQIRPDGYAYHQAGARHRDRQSRRSPSTGMPTTTPCDFYARNVQLLEGGHYRYDIVTPGGVIEGCTLGIPGWINIENSVAAVAAVWCAARAEGTEPDAEKLRERSGVVLGRQAAFRVLCELPEAGLYGRLRPPSARAGGDADLRARRCSPGGGSRRCSSPTSTPARATSVRSSPRRCRTPTRWCCCRSTRRARSRSRASRRRSSPDRVTVAPCRIVGRERLADEVAAMDTDVVISFGAGNIDACCEAIAEKLRAKS